MTKVIDLKARVQKLEREAARKAQAKAVAEMAFSEPEEGTPAAGLEQIANDLLMSAFDTLDLAAGAPGGGAIRQPFAIITIHVGGVRVTARDGYCGGLDPAAIDGMLEWIRKAMTGAADHERAARDE